jgi:hypothetical protein
VLFGVLTNKWRIFHRPLNVSEELATSIINACVKLHNSVRVRDGFNFEDTLSCEGLCNTGDIPTQQPPKYPKTTRNILTDYFTGAG